MRSLEKLAARQAIMEHLINSNLLLDILEDQEAFNELPRITTATGQRVTSGNDWLLLFVEACS